MLIRIFLLSALLTLASCSHYDCYKYDEKSAREIEIILNELPVGPLSHELFILGECKIKPAIPVLEKYLDDTRVSHHALHKGMSLSYIAKISIEKISNETGK